MTEPVTRASSSGRTAVVVLGIILGAVIGANLVNAALPPPANPGPIDTGPGVPVESPPGVPPSVEPGPVGAGQGIDVGSGFVLFPPPGWTAVGADTGIVLQRAGVLVMAAGVPWQGTPAELARAYRDQWFAGGEFTGDVPRQGSVGDGIPAAGLSYTGIWNGGQVDGVIIAGAQDGAGLTVNVVGPAGSLAAVGDDLDTILGTLRHVGG